MIFNFFLEFKRKVEDDEMEVNVGLVYELYLMLIGNVYFRVMLMLFERKYIFKVFWGYGIRL